MLNWAERMKFDLSGLPNLIAYKARVAARPKVQEALAKEGLARRREPSNKIARAGSLNI
jgi:glutathione S-transferase